MQRRKDAKSIRKALRNPPEDDPEFQIAPMIDVLLVLLVFFMSISTTEVLQTVQGINLPVAKAAEQPKKGAGQIIVNIKWENDRGVVIINEKPYENAQDITPILEEAFKNNPNTRVLVRADRDTKYEYVRSMMVSVSRANIPNITFSVVDKDAPAVPGT